MTAALDLGLIFGLMALGVYLTFRILDFADLTIDGSFTTGAATAAILLVGGWPPLAATAVGGCVGLVAGLVTGLLNTWGKIHPLLAGILTQIALYSINLRIMGRANVPLLRTETLFTPLRAAGLLGTFVSVAILAGLLALFVIALVWFLSTDVGLALRATGDNEGMARAQGINTDLMKCLGLSLSNGMVALSGALFAPARNPVVDRVGAVLPLRHSVTALRTRWPGARSAPSSRWRRVSASAGRSLLPCSIAGRTGVDAVTGRARSHRD